MDKVDIPIEELNEQLFLILLCEALESIRFKVEDELSEGNKISKQIGKVIDKCRLKIGSLNKTDRESKKSSKTIFDKLYEKIDKKKMTWKEMD